MRINQSRLSALCLLTTAQPIQPMRSAPCVSALWSLFCSPFFLYAAPISFCLFLLSALFGVGAVSLFSSFPNLSTVDFREMAEEAPELKRDSTMTVTAKVRERSKARETPKNLNSEGSLQRDWIAFISSLPQEGAQFLEEQGKVHEDAKTRAQQRELEESEEEDAASKLKRTSTMAATAQVRNQQFESCLSFAFCQRFKIQKSKRLVPYVVHF